MSDLTQAKRRIRWPNITRDGVIFVAGLAGIVHETLVSKLERPSLLVLFAVMVGLPGFLTLDEKGRKR